MPPPTSYRRVGLLLLTLLLSAQVPVASQPLERRVIGLYSSANGHSEIDNPLRLSVEFVLHHLGLHLEYHDLAAGVPDSAAMAGARGIVVWLESDRADEPEAYWRWLRRQFDERRRVILLNSPGPRFDLQGNAVPAALIQAALAPLGLQPGDNYSSMPLDIEMVDRDSAMVEFERRLRYELTRFTEMRSIDTDNEVLLQLRLRSSGARADAVVLSPRGGYAAEGYIQYRNADSGLVQWRLDPFRFFERALGVVGTPRPDPTTRLGNRVYYSHIDGDGLRNRSLIDRQRAAAEIVLEDVLERYADWPFTVSVITAEVDPGFLGSPAIVDLTRRMFALPNVEPASHSFSHPLVWDRAYESAAGISEYTDEIEGATVSGRALLPWNLSGYAFDPVAETVGSCRYLENHLLPAGRPCRVLLWSGNCLPGEEELAALDAAGILNMNGGDSRFDGSHPSYSYVKPYYRQVGSHFQVHSSNSNENTYTGLWSGPFGGYQTVIQTFENTESPRRVLPVNIYYHFYSGEQEAAMHALHVAYEWAEARRAELHPMYASQYIESVLGFIASRIERVGPRAWRVRDYAACRTVRFDGDVGWPDLDRSRGVLGFRRYQGSTYVHLANGTEALVALTDTEPTQPFLVSSSAPVSAVVIEPGGVTFTTSSLGPATMTWANLPGPLEMLVDGRDGGRRQLRGDAAGRLTLTLPAGPARRVQLRAVGAGEP